MKIKTLKAIRTLLKTKSNTLPVLDYFLIDQEYLTFTNIETIVKIKHLFPLKPDTKPFLIRADHFIQRIEKIKAPYFISGNDSLKIMFEQSESESSMTGMDPNDFPQIPKMQDPKELCTLTAYEINIMNIASQFATDDDLRPVMKTVCLDKGYIVSSDAHKLYYKKINPIAEPAIMFGKIFIKLLMQGEGRSFTILQAGRFIRAESPDITIWTREEDGNYPNWRTVLPKPTATAIIPLKETIDAISSILYAANEATGMITINIIPQRMKLSCRDIDNGISASQTVNILNPDNKEVEFGMKGRFLLSVLKCLQNEGYAQVTMGWINESKSFVFQDQILIMPMMLNTD